MEPQSSKCTSSPVIEKKITRVGQVGTAAILLGIISIWTMPGLKGWLWTFAFLVWRYSLFLKCKTLQAYSLHIYRSLVFNYWFGKLM